MKKPSEPGGRVVSERRLDVDFLCPFCGKVAKAVSPEVEAPYVVHEKPTCKEFDAMEPTPYMQAVNAAIAKRRS